jgi:hypothetical protein
MNNAEKNKGSCAHDYKKTLAKSGMYFIYMCHRCCEIKSELDNKEYSPLAQR